VPKPGHAPGFLFINPDDEQHLWRLDEVNKALRLAEMPVDSSPWMH